MKLGVLSDIHVDINLNEGEDLVIPAMADYARQNHLDAWLIPGDISSDYRLSLEALERLEKLSRRPCFFVPGNHDIWTENHRDLDSWEIYRRLQAHPGNLSKGSVKIKENWSLTGDLGWYDFSFGDPSYSPEDFNRMIFRSDDGEKKEDRVWQDSIMAVWNQPALETHGYFLDSLSQKLSRETSPNIIVLTHVLPVSDFIVGEDHPQYRMWLYLNAFLGGTSYGELFYRFPAIRHSLCGHIHYRKHVRHLHIDFFCSCLGYSTEWAEPADTAAEIQKAAVILEI